MFDFPNPSGKQWNRPPHRSRRTPEPVQVRGDEPTEGEALEVVTVRRVIVKTVLRADAEILLRNGWELVEGKEDK